MSWTCRCFHSLSLEGKGEAALAVATGRTRHHRRCSDCTAALPAPADPRRVAAPSAAARSGHWACSRGRPDPPRQKGPGSLRAQVVRGNLSLVFSMRRVCLRTLCCHTHWAAVQRRQCPCEPGTIRPAHPSRRGSRFTALVLTGLRVPEVRPVRAASSHGLSEAALTSVARHLEAQRRVPANTQPRPRSSVGGINAHLCSCVVSGTFQPL